MKHLCSIATAWAAGMLALTLFGCGSVAAPSDPSAEELVADLASPAFEGRISGSRGNEKAADYIADYFESQGLDPYFDAYGQEYQGSVLHPELAQPHLTLTTSAGEQLSLQPGEDFLCSLPEKAVEQNLPLSRDPAACRDGTAIYLAVDRLDGMQWLRENPGQTVAFCEDLQSGTVATPFGRKDGQLLILDLHLSNSLTEGASLSIQIQPAYSQGTVRNIAAVRRGSEGKSALVFSAHFDGSGILGEKLFPSALDNASGTAAMMRIAALVQQKDPQLQNDLIFVAFNSEEVGMDGSEAFAQALADQYETLSLINIDCVGLQGVPILLYAEQNGQSLWAALSALPFGDAVQTSSGSYPSDQRSFVPYRNCSPVVFGGDMQIFRSEGHIHAPLDRTDQLDYPIIEALADQLACFAVEHGDEDFSSPVQQDHEAALDRFWDEMQSWQAQVTEEYGLAYNEGLCVTAYPPPPQGFEATASNYLLYGMRYYTSPEAVAAQFPFLSLPEILGGYPFLRAAVRLDHPFCESTLSLSVQNGTGDDYRPGQIYEFEINPEALSILSAEYLVPDGSTILMLLCRGRDFYSMDPIALGEELDPRLKGWKLFGYEDTYTIAKYQQGEDHLLLWFLQSPKEQSTDPTILPMGAAQSLSREETISRLIQIDPDALIRRCIGADGA